MAEKLNMPQMGYDMKEGVVVKWLKEVGSDVSIGDPIAEIETDKAVVEFESYAEGTLQEILVEEGTKVNVGDAIAIVGDGSEEVSLESEEVSVESEEVSVESEEVSVESEEVSVESNIEEPESNELLNIKIKASPLAKVLAKDNNVDLRDVSGTGPGGRIVKSDVMNIIDGSNSPEVVEIVPSKPTTPKPDDQSDPKLNNPQESNKMRAQIARVTQRSKQEVPHYYLSTEINMDKALEIRSQINLKLESQNIKISINDLIIKAAIETLKKYPVFNSRYENNSVISNDEINISIAIALNDGLILPAIIGCNDKDIKDISTSTKDLVERTKNGKLTSAEYTKGTFSISNLGMFDVSNFLAIILPPQTSMLAVGSVKKTPVVVEDSISVSNIMHASLSADHRVTDGAAGALFIAELKNNLENPVNLII
ncbi:MAG: dihydrolipoamide acetyltransferase family protein [Dehalococcoidia bacterium]